MTIRQVPPELDSVDEVPEADAAEQHADVVDPVDPASLEEHEEPADVDHPVDDERVVVLDDDEYR